MLKTKQRPSRRTENVDVGSLATSSIDLAVALPSILPVLGAESIDENFRLIGTLRPFAGMDYTDIWNRYLQRRNNSYEKLMLNSAFEVKEGRIINSGAFVLMIAYAKPLKFIRYVLHL